MQYAGARPCIQARRYWDASRTKNPGRPWALKDGAGRGAAGQSAPRARRNLAPRGAEGPETWPKSRTGRRLPSARRRGRARGGGGAFTTGAARRARGRAAAGGYVPRGKTMFGSPRRRAASAARYFSWKRTQRCNIGRRRARRACEAIDGRGREESLHRDVQPKRIEF
jgi:hypothetical protein